MQLRTIVLLGASLAVALTACTGGGSENGGDGGDEPPGTPSTPTEPFSSGVPLPQDVVEAEPVYWELPDDPAASRVAAWIPPYDRVRGVFIDYYHFDPKVPTATRQLASMWGFAVVTHFGVGFWDEAGSTKAPGQSTQDRVAEMTLAFLDRVASESGHAELTTVPLLVQGMSRFGNQGASYEVLRPGRVLGYTNIVAGAPGAGALGNAAASLPTLVLPGEDDGGAMKVASVVEARQSRRALIGAAMNWGEEHKCGNCGLIGFPFLDQVVRLRQDAEGNVVPLTESAGWLADVGTWGQVARFDDYSGDPATAGWLPNAYVAAAWRAYVQPGLPATWAAPAEIAQTKLAAATRSSSQPVIVKVRFSDAAWENRPLALQDGDALLTSTPMWSRTSSGVTAELAVTLPPGLHTLIATSDGLPVARPGIVMLLE